ncbi:integral peroxisomal membrane peroxin-domain-containing protein [Amylostereum chailletii]|nr:integral peroxisomal membrane peroxin-domain-containing protein [Amylostereum chailletii]
MDDFEYVEIPTYATRLPPDVPSSDTSKMQPVPTSTTALPVSSPTSENPPSPSIRSNSPIRSTFGNLPGMLLASALPIPANIPEGSTRKGPLLSTRDPLSVPITTVNFRRFISKVGPVFWLQDRIEEIVLWRKGWKTTVMWMAAYAFLCYFPRLILLLPNIIIIGVILANHPSRRSTDPEVEERRLPPRANAREGSAEWLANIQGIQNLMGAFADAYDAVFPHILHLTYSTPYTPHILTFVVLLSLFSLPSLPTIPLRPVFLIFGLAPFVLTHPLVQHTLPFVLSTLPLRSIRARTTRLIDDDRLKDNHWQSPLREVELFENERWSGDSQTGGWSKGHLKSIDRVAWTRGQDGWSAVSADGSGDVSNLTFALEPRWAFVETEDWRTDVEARWSAVGSDDGGWVYTNDAWLEPHPLPVDDWKVQGGMTRRRRWTRRIYLSNL